MRLEFVLESWSISSILVCFLFSHVCILLCFSSFRNAPVEVMDLVTVHTRLNACPEGLKIMGLCHYVLWHYSVIDFYRIRFIYSGSCYAMSIIVRMHLIEVTKQSFSMLTGCMIELHRES